MFILDTRLYTLFFIAVICFNNLGKKEQNLVYSFGIEI